MKEKAPYIFALALICFACIFLGASLAKATPTPNEQCIQALGQSYDSIEELTRKFNIETRIMRDNLKYQAGELRTTMGLNQPQ